MARTVDTSSTFENWRQNYNDLASDVGGLGSLTTADKSSVVNAINYIMDQYFYFQDFEFDGSDGATSNTVFSGTDNAGNTFAYSAGKLLVFKNGLLLRSGTDYTAVNGTSVTLASSANNADIVRMSVFTGSYENVGAASSATSNQWILAGSTIYNQNIGGVVINADSTITTTLGVADSIQLQGNTYANGSIYLNAQNDLRFQDSDSSHYAAIQAPATISANYTLTLPADDGTSGQTLSTDGNGVLTWSSATATDVNVVANNTANETVYLTFVDGATGSQGVETDTNLTYNPSSNNLASLNFTGAFIGNASSATILQTNRNFSLTGNVTASAIAFNGSGAVALSTTLANDVVNSQHYVDGSIDTAHIADSQITQAKMAANAVDAAIIVDNSVGAAELNVSGNGSATQALLSDGDGTFSWGSSGHTTEELQDIIGAMFSSNTETRISATYQDGDGTIDLVVDDMTANDNTQLSNAQVRTAVEAASDSNVFTDADHTKLDGLVTNATHTGDVTGSGALTIASGAVDLGMLSASGTRNSGTFYRGDGTFAVPPTSSGTVDTSGSPVDNDFAKFTDADTIEGRSIAETKSDLSLGNVENTAISTFAGSSNITTVGTIGTGTWQGTAINQTYLTGQSGTNTGDQSSVSGNAGSATTVTVTQENSANSTAHYIPFATGTSTEAKSLKFSNDTLGGDTGLKYVPGEGASNAFGTLYVDRTISKLFYVDADNQLTDTQLKTHRIGVNMSSAGVDGRIDASNDIVAFSSSDMTLKENINPISNALDKVLSLGGYTFDWKKEREEEHGYSGSDIGVLAQEVEDVLPTAVRKNNFGNKSVRYEKLIPLLVQSIKELKSELDELKSSNS